MSTSTSDEAGTADRAGAALRAALGAERVSAATGTDAQLGARWRVAAGSTEEVATAMRVSSEHGLAVVARGGATKPDWAAEPERVDVVLDVAGVRGVVEHAAGDLVVRARAGTPLDELNAELRRHGQQLAIDHPLPGATLGGVVATAESGPARHSSGGVRDLLIGITAVLADGTVATSGGKVVKNVAGYDLGKLYTGSYGTLGVITEVVFRLHPVSSEHRWILATADAPEEAGRIAAAVRGSQAMPTAIEVDRPEPDGPLAVCAELEGLPEVTHRRAEELRSSLGLEAEIRSRPPEWWGSYPFDASGGTGLRAGAPPAELPDLLAAVQQAAAEHGVTAAVRGAAGLGVVHVGLDGAADPHRAAALIGELRRRCTYAVVLRAPREVRAAVDVWGPVEPGLHALFARTKHYFDPDRRLAPGRFAGGI
ncbi:FAD-binding oxidoreductase [Salinifilum aidingensis]